MSSLCRVAAGRTSWVLGHADGPHRGGKAIDDVQLASNILTKPDNDAGGLECREASHPARHCAQHTVLGAAVAVFGVKGIADIATVAGLRRQPARPGADLSVELVDCGGYERRAQAPGSICNGKARIGIVANQRLQ
jgi:hypothetical protein